MRRFYYEIDYGVTEKDRQREIIDFDGEGCPSPLPQKEIIFVDCESNENPFAKVLHVIGESWFYYGAQYTGHPVTITDVTEEYTERQRMLSEPIPDWVTNA